MFGTGSRDQESSSDYSSRGDTEKQNHQLESQNHVWISSCPSSPTLEKQNELFLDRVQTLANEIWQFYRKRSRIDEKPPRISNFQSPISQTLFQKKKQLDESTPIPRRKRDKARKISADESRTLWARRRKSSSTRFRDCERDEISNDLKSVRSRSMAKMDGSQNRLTGGGDGCRVDVLAPCPKSRPGSIKWHRERVSLKRSHGRLASMSDFHPRRPLLRATCC